MCLCLLSMCLCIMAGARVFSCFSLLQITYAHILTFDMMYRSCGVSFFRGVKQLGVFPIFCLSWFHAAGVNEQSQRRRHYNGMCLQGPVFYVPGRDGIVTILVHWINFVSVHFLRMLTLLMCLSYGCYSRMKFNTCGKFPREFFLMSVYLVALYVVRCLANKSGIYIAFCLS